MIFIVNKHHFNYSAMRPLSISDSKDFRQHIAVPECAADPNAFSAAEQSICRASALYRRIRSDYPAGIPDRHIYELIDAAANVITALDATANLPLRSPAVCADILPLLLFARGNFPRLDRHTAPLIAMAQQVLRESNTPLQR